jgi:hypothetical protein
MMSETLFLIEIQSWDWPLHVGVRPRSVVPDPGLEDLMCVEVITVDGVVLAPEEHRSKHIHLRLSPLARELMLGNPDERDVGRLYKDPVERNDLGFYAKLFLPADTLHSAIFCLGSIWRRIHMWIDDGAEPFSVTDFGFSADAQVSSSDQVGDA